MAQDKYDNPREWYAFTENPFDGHQGLPAAEYLCPEEIDKLRGLHQTPTKNHYRIYCNIVYRVANTIFEAVSEQTTHALDYSTMIHTGASTWAKNQLPVKGAKIWHTFAPGQPRHKPLQLIDVINSITNPKCYAVGTKTTANYNPIYHLRIDVDMDLAYMDRSIDEIREELSRENDILTSLGFHPEFFRTGNRGHQIVIPIAQVWEIDQAKEAVAAITAKLQVETKHANFDKNNLNSIMRLPLGRHALTGQVAWMIDPTTGLNLPIHQQVAAVERAFTKQCRDSIELAFDGVNSSQDRDLYTDGVSTPEPAAVVEVTEDDGTAFNRPSGHVGTSWARKTMAEKFPPGQFRMWATNPPKGTPADQRHLYKNGIGAAIILYGSEVPHFNKAKRDEYVIAKLSDYVREVEESHPGSHANRIELITRYVPLNNIDPYYAKSEKLHKDLEGEVSEEDSAFGAALARLLVDQQIKRKDIKPRVFTDSALRTLERIGSLVSMEFRGNPQERNLYTDGVSTIAISGRTLVAAIAARWPEDAKCLKDVQTQLAWIMAGESCLVEVLTRHDDRQIKTEVTKYSKGAGYGLVRLEARRYNEVDKINAPRERSPQEHQQSNTDNPPPLKSY